MFSLTSWIGDLVALLSSFSKRSWSLLGIQSIEYSLDPFTGDSEISVGPSRPVQLRSKGKLPVASPPSGQVALTPDTTCSSHFEKPKL